MARVITLTLGAGLGANLGPNFNLTTNVGSVTPSTATKSELIAGKSVSVNDAATQVTVTSTGACTNSITQAIPCGPPTTTTTTTVAPTTTTTTSTTSTTTVAPTTTTTTAGPTTTTTTTVAPTTTTTTTFAPTTTTTTTVAPTTTTTTTVAPTTTTTSTTTTTTTTSTTSTTTTTTTTVPPTTTTTTVEPTTTTTTAVIELSKFTMSFGQTIGLGGTCDLTRSIDIYCDAVSVVAMGGKILYTDSGGTTPFVGNPADEYGIVLDTAPAIVRIIEINGSGQCTNVLNCY